MNQLSFLLAVFALLTSSVVAQVQAPLPPIQLLKDVQPLAVAFQKAGRDKPIVIRTKKEVASYFSAEEAGKLTKRVDFDKQNVLVFAWKGSGQDNIEHSVLESFPEQVVFQFKPGRTRDFRPHVRVYVVRSNVRWRTATTSSDDVQKDSAEYIQVKIRGKLNSQVVAIGGETTGVMISANGVTWELELGDNARNRQRAMQLDGKSVIVTGQLRVKAGVEIAKRWIVDVESLLAADQVKARRKR